MAGTGELVEGEARGAGALVTPQGVVAGSRATGIRIGAFILVDTLIPLVMLNISLRTTTSVTSQDVLAAMLAPMVSITFINIFTVESSGIKREPSLAFTAETSRGVLTDPLCSTKGRLRPTFIVVNASSVMLCETRWTFTGKTSQSVDTEELAVVLLGVTFIKVFACLPVLLQDVSPWTRALVTPLSVLADEIARFRGLGTFIKINTRGSADVRGVANLAEAPE